MLTPLNEEIDISKYAANQSKVFLRFYWKGLEAWYWMVDDISLSEAFKMMLALRSCFRKVKAEMNLL